MQPTSWRADLAIVLIVVLAFMAVSAAAAWPWWEYAFFSDRSPVSWLSSALLAANAAVAFHLSVTRALRPALGYLLSAGLLLLALDEEFLLHERMQDSYGDGAGWPTWIVAVVGVGFLIVLIRRLDGVSRRLLIAAGTIGIVALTIDLTSWPGVIGRLEEGFEVIAESVFLCGLLQISKRQVQSVV